MEIQRVEGTVVIKPKRLVDAEDVLTTKEEEIVRSGEEQIRRGGYVTLEKLEYEMGRTSRKRRGKTT
ncbi:MAG: hypothetical protein L0Z68_01615 [Gammaproteobacteria bacterium]|nr:hypothetical protein [Gammaproteobacteria bacterium]